MSDIYLYYIFIYLCYLYCITFIYITFIYIISILLDLKSIPLSASSPVLLGNFSTYTRKILYRIDPLAEEI